MYFLWSPADVVDICIISGTQGWVLKKVENLLKIMNMRSKIKAFIGARGRISVSNECVSRM